MNTLFNKSSVKTQYENTLPAKVSANNAVPGGRVLLVEFLFDVCGDILFNVELLQCLTSYGDSILLHLLGHVGIFNDGFTVGHCFVVWGESEREPHETRTQA